MAYDPTSPIPAAGSFGTKKPKPIAKPAPIPAAADAEDTSATTDIGAYMPGSGYGRDMKDQVSQAYEKGGVAAGVGKAINLTPGAVLAAGADIVKPIGDVAERVIRPWAQTLKTAVTGDATPIGQEPAPAASAAPAAQEASVPVTAATATEKAAAETPAAVTPQAAQPAQFGAVRSFATPVVDSVAGPKEVDAGAYKPTTLAGALVQNNEAKRQSGLQQQDNTNALAAFNAAGARKNQDSEAGLRTKQIQEADMKMGEQNRLGAMRNKYLALNEQNDPDGSQRAALSNQIEVLTTGNKDRFMPLMGKDDLGNPIYMGAFDARNGKRVSSDSPPSSGVSRAQVDAAAKAKGITDPAELQKLYTTYGVK